MTSRGPGLYALATFSDGSVTESELPNLMLSIMKKPASALGACLKRPASRLNPIVLDEKDKPMPKKIKRPAQEVEFEEMSQEEEAEEEQPVEQDAEFTEAALEAGVNDEVVEVVPAVVKAKAPKAPSA